MHDGSRIVRVYTAISSEKESKARHVEATWIFLTETRKWCTEYYTTLYWLQVSHKARSDSLGAELDFIFCWEVATHIVLRHGRWEILRMDILEK